MTMHHLAFMRNPKVIKPEAQRDTGTEELVDEILAHRDYLFSSGTINNFLRERNQRHFMDILRDTLVNKALLFMATDNSLDRIVTGISDHSLDPYSAVEEIISKMMPD